MRRTIGTFSIALGLLGLGALPSPVRAGSPPALSGGILGQVKNVGGIAQMGATVLLYDRYDQLVRRALSNEQGKFAFDQLTPDSYSIRVTLASFVPAFRRQYCGRGGIGKSSPGESGRSVQHGGPDLVGTVARHSDER